MPSKKDIKSSKLNHKSERKTKSLTAISKLGGIKTSEDFKEVFCALIEDLLIGTVTPQIGNAMCNAGGRVIRVSELALKYGKRDNSGPVLRLSR